MTTGFGGRIIKFGIGVKNNSGTALESAVISVWIVFVFQT